MSSISSIRLSGLATGMDTDAMVKEMVTAEQNKIDKAKQKEQIINWQQETYREIISDVKNFNDKYFSLTSKDSIINSSAWNTLTTTSSNISVITATGTAGASNVDYKFDVKKLAEPAKVISSIDIKKDSKLVDLGATDGDKFKFALGKDDQGNVIYSDVITIESGDTVDSLIKKINDSSKGELKASYSEMTGKFTIESTKTGSNSGFAIFDENGNSSNSLDFLGLETKTYQMDQSGNFVLDVQGNPISNTSAFNGTAVGSNSIINVSSKDGSFSKVLNEESNSFTIDGIKYNVHSIGTSEITSKKDTSAVVEKMKTFVDDYNKIMDKMYDLVTQKENKDYPPLTEAQKKEMSEEEIEAWEKKAKQGILRNDSEMRRFMDDMQNAIFGNNMAILNEMGLTTHEDYNKRGQISLDEEKFIKALENNSEKVYEVFAKDSSSVMEGLKSTVNKYIGGSSSVFAKKAGLEKTASAVKNFYSEQLKKQAEIIKNLQQKMSDKENSLYKKFGALESSMNKLNSQMNYFMQG